ncbi:MAG: restriction endonuclease [Acidobacteriota bacterium]|nr:restriction endonuclease [Acidobacteriota bacterium]
MAEGITRDRGDEMMREVFRALVEMGGRGRPGEIFARIEPRLRLSDHERGTVKTGGARWEVLLRWYSVDCTKAGFLEKSGGYWALTPQGEEALKLPPGGLMRQAQLKYKEWRNQRGEVPPLSGTVEGVEGVEEVEEVEEERVARQTVYEQAVETARAGIEEHINQLGPYEFQNLVAELLRAMGYHVPHVAAPGPDGGVDLLAYRDPLGTAAPRIKVQVKHREQKASAKEVRELEGLLRREGDVGILVSSGGFTSEATREARASHQHIELMDLNRLIALWIDHYPQMREAGRSLLPLIGVHFLAPQDDQA